MILRSSTQIGQKEEFRKYVKTPFFRMDPLLYHKFQNKVIFGQETYIDSVAQETSIIINLFIITIFHQTRSKSAIKNMGASVLVPRQCWSRVSVRPESVFVLSQCWSRVSVGPESVFVPKSVLVLQGRTLTWDQH